MIWLIGHVSKLRWSRRKPAQSAPTTPFTSGAAPRTDESRDDLDPVAAPPDAPLGTESPPQDDSGTDLLSDDTPEEGGRRDG